MLFFSCMCSGDTDAVVPFTGEMFFVVVAIVSLFCLSLALSLSHAHALSHSTGTRAWLDESGWRISRSKSPFYVDGQLAGGFVEYEDGKITFATVHGAGHMVPGTQPARALWMFQTFLTNRSLS